MFFNDAGDKVFLRYDYRWTGGSFMGGKQPDGSWKLRSVSTWIT